MEVHTTMKCKGCRSGMQIAQPGTKHDRSLAANLRMLYREKGLRGCYPGLSPVLLRSFPANAAQWCALHAPGTSLHTAFLCPLLVEKAMLSMPACNHSDTTPNVSQHTVQATSFTHVTKFWSARSHSGNVWLWKSPWESGRDSLACAT